MLNNRNYALAGRAFTYAGQFLVIAILPLVLTPALFAKYNLVLPALTLTSSMVYGWLNGAAFRWSHKILADNKQVLRNSITFYYLALLALSAFASLTLWIIGRPLEAIYPILIYAMSVKDYFSKLSNSAEDYRRFAIANGINLIGKIIFVFAIYFYSIGNFSLILVILTISEIVFIAPFTSRAHRLQRQSYRKHVKALSSALSYGGPLIAASLSVWLISLSDRYILAKFATDHAVANYVLIYQFCANAIGIPIAFFITVFYPKLMRMEREDGLENALKYNRDMLYKYLKVAPTYAIVIGLGIYMAMRYAYTAYEPNASVIALIMASQILCGASHFYNKKFELTNKTHLVAICVFVSSIVSVALNLLLIPQFGGVGAAISSFFSYALLLLVTANIDDWKMQTNHKIRILPE